MPTFLGHFLGHSIGRSLSCALSEAVGKGYHLSGHLFLRGERLFELHQTRFSTLDDIL